MDISKIRKLLADIQQGSLSIDEGIDQLRNLPYDNLGYAQLDLHRPLRKGTPEVVFCQFKTNDQVIRIFQRLWQYHDRVMGTRVSPEMAAVIQAELPEARYDPISRLLTLARVDLPLPTKDCPYIAVFSGGTADMPVAEEAAQTLEFLGDRVERAYDVGVAGIHRLLDQRHLINGASVVISVAGMEGALTSVVAGLAACPVIGVPTSVGYGASFNGLAALLSMLNSCSTGVAVVNIDNGFGAGQFAHAILTQIKDGGQA